MSVYRRWSKPTANVIGESPLKDVYNEKLNKTLKATRESAGRVLGIDGATNR